MVYRVSRLLGRDIYLVVLAIVSIKTPAIAFTTFFYCRICGIEDWLPLWGRGRRAVSNHTSSSVREALVSVHPVCKPSNSSILLTLRPRESRSPRSMSMNDE